MAQLGTAARQQGEAAVCQPDAAVQQHPLHCVAQRPGRVATEEFDDLPERPVGAGRFPGQSDARPQLRLPDEEVPAPADPGAVAQLVGRQVGEDVHDQLVREPVERRRLVRPLALEHGEDHLVAGGRLGQLRRSWRHAERGYGRHGVAAGGRLSAPGRRLLPRRRSRGTRHQRVVAEVVGGRGATVWRRHQLRTQSRGQMGHQGSDGSPGVTGVIRESLARAAAGRARRGATPVNTPLETQWKARSRDRAPAAALRRESSDRRVTLHNPAPPARRLDGHGDTAATEWTQ